MLPAVLRLLQTAGYRANLALLQSLEPKAFGVLHWSGRFEKHSKKNVLAAEVGHSKCRTFITNFIKVLCVRKRPASARPVPGHEHGKGAKL